MNLVLRNEKDLKTLATASRLHAKRQLVNLRETLLRFLDNDPETPREHLQVAWRRYWYTYRLYRELYFQAYRVWPEPPLTLFDLTFQADLEVADWQIPILQAVEKSV